MNKSASGFTLIEVLIALLILAFSMSVLVESWGGSFRGIKKARTYSVIAMLLQRKITDFELFNKNKSAEEIKELENGDFGSDYPEYTWEIKSQPFEFPNIFPAFGEGKQDEISKTIIKTMLEYFNKTIKEVTVTVIYKPGKRTQRFSATLLYIDFDKELSLGM